MMMIIIICTFCPDDMMSAHREQTISMKMNERIENDDDAIYSLFCLRLYDVLFQALSSIK
jgi:hypothetical protein